MAGVFSFYVTDFQHYKSIIWLNFSLKMIKLFSKMKQTCILCVETMWWCVEVSRIFLLDIFDSVAILNCCLSEYVEYLIIWFEIYATRKILTILIFSIWFLDKSGGWLLLTVCFLIYGIDIFILWAMMKVKVCVSSVVSCLTCQIFLWYFDVHHNKLACIFKRVIPQSHEKVHQ